MYNEIDDVETKQKKKDASRERKLWKKKYNFMKENLGQATEARWILYIKNCGGERHRCSNNFGRIKQLGMRWNAAADDDGESCAVMVTKSVCSIFIFIHSKIHFTFYLSARLVSMFSVWFSGLSCTLNINYLLKSICFLYPSQQMVSSFHIFFFARFLLHGPQWRETHPNR